MAVRILIVDDEEHIRDSCVRLLRGKKYEAEGAASGVEALEMIARETYDIVLLDFKMAGMDGIEVLRRSMKIAPEIPVLILTGHGTIDTANEAIALGAADFIRKPIVIDSLTERIDEALERSRARRDNI